MCSCCCNSPVHNLLSCFYCCCKFTQCRISLQCVIIRISLQSVVVVVVVAFVIVVIAVSVVIVVAVIWECVEF